MPKNKVVPIEEAMSHIKSGMSIAVGGFIGQGDPLTLIDYLKTMDVGDLTIYENDAGYRERGVVELVKQGKIKKIVASHIGTTPEIGKAMNEGRLEVEPTPQGTLAEMMRCGGAGLGGFLTPDRHRHGGRGGQADHRAGRPQVHPRAVAQVRHRHRPRPRAATPGATSSTAARRATSTCRPPCAPTT